MGVPPLGAQRAGRLAGCRDYFSKYEDRFHVSPTANQHDAIDTVELAPAECAELFWHPLVDDCPVDPETGGAAPGGHAGHR